MNSRWRCQFQCYFVWKIWRTPHNSISCTRTRAYTPRTACLMTDMAWVIQRRLLLIFQINISNSKWIRSIHPWNSQFFSFSIDEFDALKWTFRINHFPFEWNHVSAIQIQAEYDDDDDKAFNWIMTLIPSCCDRNHRFLHLVPLRVCVATQFYDSTNILSSFNNFVIFAPKRQSLHNTHSLDGDSNVPFDAYTERARRASINSIKSERHC